MGLIHRVLRSGLVLTALVAAMVFAFAIDHVLASPPVVQVSASDGNCIIDDNQSGFVTVNVVLVGSGATSNALAASFRVGSGGGFTGVLISEDYAAGVGYVGNTTDGVIVGFPGCQSGAFQIAQLTFQIFGTSSSCAYLEVTPYPGDASIMVSDCSGVAEASNTLGPLLVNYDSGCGSLWCVLPVESSTWGRVKALYR